MIDMSVAGYSDNSANEGNANDLVITSSVNQGFGIKEFPRFLPVWAKPPWPEWSDAVINREVWEENESIEMFEDPTGEIEPNAITPANWIRPSNLFLEPPKLFDWTAPTIDLITPNTHICELSDVVRFILSEISELYDYGVANDLQLEGEGVSFITNSEHEGVSWKPWDHIYSCCKAGVKGDRPIFNHMGKYYVRLYFMGCWRRITVDDKIPLLQNGRIGLPITSTNEIWPMILTKALMKIASLTWEDGKNQGDTNRFSSISALTGMVHEWIDIREPVTGTVLWDELHGILPKYKRPVVRKSVPGNKYKGRQKSEDNEEPDVLWWSSTVAEDKEDSIEYQEFSDSDTTVVKDVDEPLQSSVHKDHVDHHKHKKHHKFNRRKSLLKRKQEHEAHQLQESQELVSAETDAEEEESKVVEKKEPVKKKKQKKEKKEQVSLKANRDSKDGKKGKKGDKKDKGKSKKKSKDEEQTVTDQPKDAAEEADNEEEEKEQGQDKPKKEKKKSKQKDLKTKKLSKEKSKKPKKKDVLEEPDVSVKGKKRKSTKGSIGKGKGKNSLNTTTEEEAEILETIYVSEEEVFKHESKQEQHFDKPKRPAHAPHSKQRTKVPHMHDILQGVYKYSGYEYFSLLNNWVSICGKNIPAILTVVLKLFPKPEENGTLVPSFLHHPMQLIELRDVLLQSDRPPTPLWKTFRWKHWAMKKGLIPMEEENIRCIKVRTPFVLKTDWYNYGIGLQSIGFDEYGGEGEEEMIRARLELEMENLGYTPPPQSPVLDTLCGGGGVVSIPVPSVTFKKQSVLITTTKIHLPPTPTLMPPKNEEEWEGEIDGMPMESAPLPTPVNFDVPVEVIPTSACGTLWFQSDSLAPNIKKLCKLYSSRNLFGSCFVLRRIEDWDNNFPRTAETERVSTVPETNMKSPKYFSDFHAIPNSPNLTIKFDSFKILDITSFNVNPMEGIESAYYLFSDCWTEQEILITLDVLQDSIVQKFTDRALHAGAVPEIIDEKRSTPILLKNSKLNVGFTLEPWDWRKDCCLRTPLIYSSTDSTWSTHLTLPPGRNLFRIWLTEDFVPENVQSGTSKDNQEIKFKNVTEGITPFVLRLISKTPINVGTREEIQNYMTNEPVLFLKQCERIAHDIWTMFALFGKNRSAYVRCLKKLRKLYCPSYIHPDVINRDLKGVHATFENYFVSMIAEMNNGRIDALLLLAIKCLLLSPSIGVNSSEARAASPVANNIIVKETHIRDFKKLGILPAVLIATSKIQRYCRGWLVRRLFQFRTKGHKRYMLVEYNVRKIAYLLAKQTDSTFLHQENQQENGQPHPSGVVVTEPHTSAPSHLIPPTLIPNPPLWTVNMFKHLLSVHPLLVSRHLHAYCASHHIRIREIEGTVPSLLKHSPWLPFVRQQFCINGESKECYCMIDLKVYPSRGIFLKIYNNDTNKYLKNAKNKTFLGKLRSNKLGYTILCYRWAVKPGKENPGRVSSNQWKIRIITPSMQDLFVFKDDVLLQIPKDLCLTRFTGYYIPNNDNSVCRYAMETTSDPHLTLRFKTNNPAAMVRFQIWDLTSKTLVFEYSALGGFLLPSVLIDSMIVKNDNDSNNDFTRGKIEVSKNENNIKPESLLQNDFEKNTSSKSVVNFLLPETVQSKSDVDSLLQVNSPRKSVADSLLQVNATKSGVDSFPQLNATRKSVANSLAQENTTRKSVANASLQETATRKSVANASLQENATRKSVANSSQQLIETRKSVANSSPQLNETRKSVANFSSQVHAKTKSVADLSAQVNAKTFNGRYSISVFVTENSWPLDNRQWIFVHNKRRKFLKKLRKWGFKNLKKVGKEETKITKEAPSKEIRKKIENQTKQVVEDQQVNDEIIDDGKDDPLKKTGKKRKKKDVDNMTVIMSSKSDPDKSKPDSLVKSGDTQSLPLSKIKGKGKKTKKDNREESFQDDHASKSSKSDLKAENLTDFITDFVENIEYPCYYNNFKKYHKHEIHKEVSANLTVMSGGKYSEKIHHHLDPNWLLEIVTDSDKTYNFINNREEFKQQLREIKMELKSQREEPIQKPSICKGIHLLQHLCPVNYISDDPSHRFVDPVSNFYNLKPCEDLEKCDIDGYKGHNFIKCLQQGWKKLSKIKKAAVPRKLKILPKTKGPRKTAIQLKLKSIDGCSRRKDVSVSFKRSKSKRRSRFSRKVKRGRKKEVKMIEGLAERVRIATEAAAAAWELREQTAEDIPSLQVTPSDVDVSTGTELPVKKQKNKRRTEVSAFGDDTTGKKKKGRKKQDHHNSLTTDV